MKFKNKKGFTLVELVIAMAISVIILAAIMTMSKPINNLANMTISYDSKRTVANEINNFVCQNIKYATYANIYTNYRDLPSDAISNFVTLSGAAVGDIRVIALINDFDTEHGGFDHAENLTRSSYNGPVTADDYGRIFKSEEVFDESFSKVKYYTAMGDWYYGNNKFQFEFSYDYIKGTVTIKTITYENGNPSLEATSTSKFLNFESSNFTIDDGGSLIKNTYIIYTKK